MSFLEHLDELRKRIVHALLAIAVGVCIGFAFINSVFDFLLAPDAQPAAAGSRMIYTQPGEAFWLNIQIALIAGDDPRRAGTSCIRSGCSSRPGSTQTRRSSPSLSC